MHFKFIESIYGSATTTLCSGSPQRFFFLYNLKLKIRRTKKIAESSRNR